MNPIEWFAWLYGKCFLGHPVRGGVVVALIWAGFGLLLWIRGVDKYNEDHKPPRTETQSKAGNGSATTTPPVSLQQQRLTIISQLVEDYQAAHNGENPTFEWLNKKLKEQGADFRVNPPTPPAGTAMFHGGRFEGNGTAIENHNPNARFIFDGTDFINNKKGIVNIPPAQQEKKKEPKP